MRNFAILLALSLRAETPKLAPPDSRAIENVRQFAHSLASLSCTQTTFPGTAKTITVEFSAPRAGAASSIDTVSLLQDVFAVSSGTQFEFDHWGALDGKKLSVYRYSYQINGKTHAGSIYADENTGAIARVVFRGVDTPAHLFCSAKTQ
jgi:hypothetical protein